MTAGSAPRAGRPPWWVAVAGVLVAAALAAGLLTGGWVPRLDERVAAVVDGWGVRSSAASPLLRPAAELGGRAVLAGVLLAVAVGLGWRHRTARPLVQAVLALAVLAAVVSAVKLGAGRAAPASGDVLLTRDGTSFPSGHVANAVVVWGVLRWQAVAHRAPPAARRLAASLAVLAPAAAGLAMLLLGYHWLSDVVAGAAIGVSLLGVVHALDEVTLSLWVRARAGRRTA